MRRFVPALSEVINDILPGESYLMPMNGCPETRVSGPSRVYIENNGLWEVFGANDNLVDPKYEAMG